jgi:uncharacterized protein (TIGR03067 family)
MRFASTLLIVSAVGLLAANDARADETDSVAGKWSAVSFSEGGKAAPSESIKDVKLNFDDRTYTNLLGTEVVEEGGYKVDPSKSPKTIDLEIKKGPDAGKKQLGIYKIEGGRLTFVFARPGSDDRPKSFTIERDSPLVELVLEKTKP